MTARLQAATSSGKPILLRVEYDAGHGMGSTKIQLEEEMADDWSSFCGNLGWRDFSPEGAQGLANGDGCRCFASRLTEGSSFPVMGAQVETFDSTLSPESRSSLENGIWLSHICAAKIDRDGFVTDSFSSARKRQAGSSRMKANFS